jgi:hypothetical protein
LIIGFIIVYLIEALLAIEDGVPIIHALLWGIQQPIDVICEILKGLGITGGTIGTIGTFLEGIWGDIFMSTISAGEGVLMTIKEFTSGLIGDLCSILPVW